MVATEVAAVGILSRMNEIALFIAILVLSGWNKTLPRVDTKMINMLLLIKEYTMVDYIMVWPATHAHEPISERPRDGASTRPGPSLFPSRCHLTIPLTLLTPLE